MQECLRLRLEPTLKLEVRFYMTKTFGISVSMYIRFNRQVNETFIHFLPLNLKGAGREEGESEFCLFFRNISVMFRETNDCYDY